MKKNWRQECEAIRALLEERDRAQREMINIRFAAHGDLHINLEHSLTLAREDLGNRLEGMNEFREEMRLSDAKYVTRAEADASRNALEARNSGELNGLEQRLRTNETNLQELRGKALTGEYAEAANRRFQGLDKLVWMGAGAAGVLQLAASALLYLLLHR